MKDILEYDGGAVLWSEVKAIQAHEGDERVGILPKVLIHWGRDKAAYVQFNSFEEAQAKAKSLVEDWDRFRNPMTHVECLRKLSSYLSYHKVAGIAESRHFCRTELRSDSALLPTTLIQALVDDGLATTNAGYQVTSWVGGKPGNAEPATQTD